MIIPEDLKSPDERRRCRVNRFALKGSVRERISCLIVPAAQKPNQERVTMVKALRRWLEANELPAIVAGVVGGLILLSMLLVLGGYLIVAR